MILDPAGWFCVLGLEVVFDESCLAPLGCLDQETDRVPGAKVRILAGLSTSGLKPRPISEAKADSNRFVRHSLEPVAIGAGQKRTEAKARATADSLRE